MTSFWRDDISPDHDPHKVLIVRDKLIDASRDGRVVKIKVYYPFLKNASGAQARYGQTKLPIVIWSHGLGGSVDGAAFLSRFISSHGFVIVHVQHHGTDSSLWEGQKGHPWDIIRKAHIPRQASLDRFADIPFVLDQLPEWMEMHPEIGDHADLSTLGMSGHSFGALTTQIMAGMQFPNMDGVLRSMKEARFKSGILYSPNPITHLGDYDMAQVFGGIDIPVFHMSGTDDSSPVEDWDYKKRLLVYQNSHDVEKYLLILKEGDHMVFNGSRGKLGQNPSRHKHEEIIKISALAFWEATLKNDKITQDWLTGGGFSSYLAAEGTFESKT